MYDSYPTRTEWDRELYPMLWGIDLAFRMRDEKTLVEGLRKLSDWFADDSVRLLRQSEQRKRSNAHPLRKHRFGLDAYEVDALCCDDEEDDEDDNR